MSRPSATMPGAAALMMSRCRPMRCCRTSGTRATTLTCAETSLVRISSETSVPSTRVHGSSGSVLTSMAGLCRQARYVPLVRVSWSAGHEPPGQRPVHRAGVQVAQAERARDTSRRARLPGPRRPVHGYDEPAGREIPTPKWYRERRLPLPMRSWPPAEVCPRFPPLQRQKRDKRLGGGQPLLRRNERRVAAGPCAPWILPGSRLPWPEPSAWAWFLRSRASRNLRFTSSMSDFASPGSGSPRRRHPPPRPGLCQLPPRRPWAQSGFALSVMASSFAHSP